MATFDAVERSVEEIGDGASTYSLDCETLQADQHDRIIELI